MKSIDQKFEGNPPNLTVDLWKVYNYNFFIIKLDIIGVEKKIN